MAVQRTLIGNIKGPKGDKGDTGDTGARGAGATVTIGSVTTTAYGGSANVTNSGTSTDAVLDFVLPQGAPGETVTDMEDLTLSSMTQPSVQFPTPSIGDTGKVLFGKVTKWFSDAITLIGTKLNIANVTNSHAITDSGYAMDARQANPNVSGSLAAQINALSSIGSYRDTTVQSGGLTVPTSASTDVYTNVMILTPASGPGLYMYIFRLSTGSSTPYIRRVRLYYAFNQTASQYWVWDGDQKRTAGGVGIIRVTQEQLDASDPRVFLQVNVSGEVNFPYDSARNNFFLMKIGERLT